MGGNIYILLIIQMNEINFLGRPSRREGLRNKHRIQFTLQSYRLNLQLDTQFFGGESVRFTPQETPY
jgi:hypothetical protein